MTNRELAAQCLIEAAEILNEGAVKTNKKKKLDKYLNKYGYIGDKKEGNITVDGKKYHIIRNQDMVGADLSNDNDIIYLNKNFAKLKNNKRRDVILQHEIGHLKHHKLSGKDSTDAHRKAAIDNVANNYAKETESDKKDYIDELDGMFPNKSKESKDYSKNDKIKIENLKKFKKYDKSDVYPHAHPIEFEADAYAQSQKNGDHLKRALRDSYKHEKRKIKKLVDKEIEDSNEKSEFMHKFNKMADTDMHQRSKAMKDKTINRNVYKTKNESIELLLYEAIELLELED